MVETPLWRQFRRLLVGAVVEAFVEAGVEADLPTLLVRFDDESAFRVPRLDNYMRFKGQVSVHLRAPIGPVARTRVLGRLRQVWPELLSVLDLPIGDTLTAERADVSLVDGGDQELTVRFDLAAD